MAIDDDMQLIAHLLDDIDQISRVAYTLYQSYDPAVFARAQPSRGCEITYDHMVAGS